MKEKVIAILATHDQLRAHEREDFKLYLASVFTEAEQVPALVARVMSLETQVPVIASLEAQVASLTERITALEAAQATPAA